MPHLYSKSCIILFILGLEIEWATSIFQNSCFSLCLKPNYIIHTSHSLILPHLDPSPTFFFFFFLFFFFLPFFFFFGLWIQLQVTHLALSSSFGLKHRLFMNFARLVHILCSIWPYENGLIKQFKHKDQCPIYNASPSCFGKFLFLWKTCLNLYSKWAMIFRSPHLFFSFLLFIFYFFFEEKKWPSFISTHQNLLLVPLQSPSWMFTLSPLLFSNGPCL